MQELLLFLVVGLVAGWLAGQIMKGKGFGLIGNLVVGVVGAYIGGFVFRSVGISTFGSGIIGPIIAAVIGAIILLWIIGLVKKA